MVGAMTHQWGMGATRTQWRRPGWAVCMVGARGCMGTCWLCTKHVGAGQGQECGVRGTKGWAVEGHLSMVTCRYVSGAGGRIRVAWGHGHGAWGDPEWPVGCGMRMGHGRSLVVKEWHAEQMFSRAPFHLPSYTLESATPAVVACRGWPWWHVEGSNGGQWAVTWVACDRAGCRWHAQVQVVGEKASVGARVSESNEHV